MNQSVTQISARGQASRNCNVGRESVPASSKFLGWCKRLGFFGFMFFLVKGLLWLTVPAILARQFAD